MLVGTRRKSRISPRITHITNELDEKLYHRLVFLLIGSVATFVNSVFHDSIQEFIHSILVLFQFYFGSFT